jgi:hypothetical protein
MRAYSGGFRRAPDAARVPRLEPHAQLPVEVGMSPQFCWLPHFAVRVLITLAGQYRGFNNGALTLSVATAEQWGVSRSELYAGLSLLKHVGFIEETVPPRRKSGHGQPARYALSWRKLDESAKFNIAASATASKAWTATDLETLGPKLRSLREAERWRGHKRYGSWPTSRRGAHPTTVYLIESKSLKGVRRVPHEKPGETVTRPSKTVTQFRTRRTKNRNAVLHAVHEENRKCNAVTDPSDARSQEEACHACGTTMDRKRRNAMYCSSSCRQKAYRRRSAEVA